METKEAKPFLTRASVWTSQTTIHRQTYFINSVEEYSICQLPHLSIEEQDSFQLRV